MLVFLVTNLLALVSYSFWPHPFVYNMAGCAAKNSTTWSTSERCLLSGHCCDCLSAFAKLISSKPSKVFNTIHCSCRHLRLASSSRHTMPSGWKSCLTTLVVLNSQTESEKLHSARCIAVLAGAVFVLSSLCLCPLVKLLCCYLGYSRLQYKLLLCIYFCKETH